MNKLIKVLKKHIKTSEFGIKNCPVALALKDSGYSDVSVGLNVIFIGLKIIKSPRSVDRFINKFDRKKSVKPFNFILKY